MPKDYAHFAPYIVPLLIFGLILYRSGRARKVRVTRIWIRPLIILVLTGGTLAVSPLPGVLTIAAFVAVAVLGAGIGYLLVRHQELSIHPETGVISSKATQIGTILIVGLFAVRFGLRYAFPEMAAQPGSHVTAAAVAWSDGSLIFAAALLVTQSVFMWMKTRPLVAEHKARIAASAPQP